MHFEIRRGKPYSKQKYYNGSVFLPLSLVYTVHTLNTRVAPDIEYKCKISGLGAKQETVFLTRPDTQFI